MVSLLLSPVQHLLSHLVQGNNSPTLNASQAAL